MLIDLSLVDLVEGVTCGKIRAESLMQEVYTRIEQYNSKLNVFLSLLPYKTALDRAKKIDQKISLGQKVGKLAGIPVSIKDNICINDPELSNSCGSQILRNYHSPYNATVVEKVLNEDAIIIGTTTCMSLPWAHPQKALLTAKRLILGTMIASPEEAVEAELFLLHLEWLFWHWAQTQAGQFVNLHQCAE